MLESIAPLILAIGVQDVPKATPEDIDFAAEQARFAMDLYRALDDAPANLVFSPFSLSRALSMVREGAAGETAQELDRTLHLPEHPGSRFLALAQIFRRPEAGREDAAAQAYSLDFATALWNQRGTHPRKDFDRNLHLLYEAKSYVTDFSQPDAARATINAWAAENTGGRVPEIIPAGLLSADTRLVLVDTVHFIASWQERFRERDTKPAPFTPSNGQPVEVPTMHRIERFRYAETDLAQVLELSYERGSTAMLVVLPKRGQTLDVVTAREDFATWTRELAPRRVDVALPRFRFTWGSELTPVLRGLGVQRAFDMGRAEFPGIFDERWAIAAVLQQTFIAVDEHGTEAAAATAVTMGVAAAAANDEPIAFHADRPFLFFVRHTQTGTVLFLGRIEDPTR